MSNITEKDIFLEQVKVFNTILDAYSDQNNCNERMVGFVLKMTELATKTMLENSLSLHKETFKTYENPEMEMLLES